MRVIAGALALFPLGFLMGTMFPKGIACLEERAPALIPWASGINGAARRSAPSGRRCWRW